MSGLGLIFLRRGGQSHPTAGSDYIKFADAEVYRILMEKGVSAHHQYDDTTVTYYPTASYPIVEFSTGGFGIAPSGYYTGFYYSPEDIPVRYNGNGTITKRLLRIRIVLQERPGRLGLICNTR